MIAIMHFKKLKFNSCTQTRTEREREHIFICMYIYYPATSPYPYILPILSHSFYYCKHTPNIFIKS